ncbi:MAG TPA: peptidylprolyl isomerase [Saprospiraceae bacterium]|nr:peptidylprolyl isomerase [Saprospiraceae bacterium]
MKKIFSVMKLKKTRSVREEDKREKLLMNRINHLFFWGLVLLFSYSCTPAETNVEDIATRFDDPTLLKILDFQYEQNVDSLIRYMESPSANVRYHAALAFGSFQDSALLAPLSAYLSDPHPEVRGAVAFAIGQTGTNSAVSALMDAFDAYDTSGVYHLANSQILEAVGKCGDASSLDLLTGISTYQVKDTLLLLGQSRGIYRLALRGVVSEVGTQKMLGYVTEEAYPRPVRLMAANYLYRTQNIDLSPFVEELSQLLFREKDPEIRSPLVIALGKTQQTAAAAALEQRFRMDTDYRVKCNIIRALSNFDYALVKATIEAGLKDPNPHVALTAANFCRDNGIAEEAANYWRIAKDTVPALIVPTLYAAAQRHLPPIYAEARQGLNGEIRRRFRDTADPYLQAAYLEALAEFGWNYRFIQQQGFAHEDPVVRTKSVALIAQILAQADFRNFFGVSYRNVRRELAVFLKDAIRTNDPGMVTLAAQSLKDVGSGPQSYLVKIDSSFIEDAFLQLDLPRDQEAYEALVALAKELDRPNIPELTMEDYLYDIDWSVLQGMENQAPRARLETDKGEMLLELYPSVAPASVVNFVLLAREGFYENLPFHRVVSNFVVQAGCDRGDGFGGAPRLIRSELKPVYYDQAGVLGMARSGLHTESSQFFITHSPSPHLDGNYTIFGQLIEGREVLEAIMQGDTIRQISILN